MTAKSYVPEKNEPPRKSERCAARVLTSWL
ncbi:hypothetical protein LCGC14_2188270, partial [marine sediment metagenome]